MPARFIRRRAQGARASCELLSSARFRPSARCPDLHRCRTRRFRTFHDSAILTASPAFSGTAGCPTTLVLLSFTMRMRSTDPPTFSTLWGGNGSVHCTQGTVCGGLSSGCRRAHFRPGTANEIAPTDQVSRASATMGVRGMILQAG
jgi:hypothetical protein